MSLSNIESAVVVMQERSAGNETIGNMWTETRVFSPNTTLAEVFKWVDGLTGSPYPFGKTIIRLNHPGNKEFP